MRRLIDQPWFQFLHGVFAKGTFVLLTAVEIPLLLILERLILPEDRPRLWRLFSHFNCRTLLFLIGVRVKKERAPSPLSPPLVFASNHPALLDGFICFAIFGPDTIFLTAPHKSVSFPFNVMFQRMGLVEVTRDDYDALHYPGALPPKKALQHMIVSLQKGLSAYVFPEGHVERLGQLLYIHTGTARIAVSSGVPVQPLVLLGSDCILLGKIRVRPGVLTVRFGSRIPPARVTPARPYRKAVREMTERIESTFEDLLPAHMLSDHENEEPKQIAAFFDIDRTIYEGFSQKDFLRFLSDTHRLSHVKALRLFGMVFLEKTGLLSHDDLLRQVFSFLRGWKEEYLNQLSKRFFEERALLNVSAHILPYLKTHREAGHKVVLITEVAHPLARVFEEYVYANAVIDTRLETRDGRYTGRVLHLCRAGEKANAAGLYASRHGIKLTHSYAYADSTSDLPLLELVGHPVAVHPDQALHHIARERAWPVLS